MSRAPGGGRVQREALNALKSLGEANTCDIAQWVYKICAGERMSNDVSKTARRVLDQIADRIGRSPGRGRPYVWKLKSRAQ
jgi:hypothetical protein